MNGEKTLDISIPYHKVNNTILTKYK